MNIPAGGSSAASIAPPSRRSDKDGNTWPDGASQTHDPRQLLFFDFMANQIEEIREENIQDDMREESIPAPATQIEQKQSISVTPEAELKKEETDQQEPARTEKPFPFPTNDGDKRRPLASMEVAIPYMSCKTAPACTAPTRPSCSSLTVKKERPKNCLKMGRTTI